MCIRDSVVRAQDRRDEQADQSQASVECEVPACHRRMIFRAQLVSPLDSCCFTQFERARAIWAGLIRVFIRCNGCQRTSVFSGMKEQRPLLFSPLRLYPKKSGYFAHCPAIISQLLRGCDLRYLHDALGLSSIGHALQAIRAAIYTSCLLYTSYSRDYQLTTKFQHRCAEEGKPSGFPPSTR